MEKKRAENSNSALPIIILGGSMIKKFCIDQSQVNEHNHIAFFSAVFDYLIAEHKGDRFEIEDLNESLEARDSSFEKGKKGGWTVRVVRQKDKFHFQGPFNNETANKFKVIWQKQKEYSGHECPFLHLRVFADQEEVFGSFDYGSIIIFDFDDAQAEKFKEHLIKAGLPVSLVIPLEKK